MLNRKSTTAVGLAGSILLVAAAVAGCGDDKSSTPSSSKSSATSVKSTPTPVGVGTAAQTAVRKQDAAIKAGLPS